MSWAYARRIFGLRQHGPDELAHYAKDCYDIEYRFPWGWAELEGIADRTDYDLKQHAEFSGEDLTYFDDELQERYYPYVIEPSGGVDRATLAFWLDAYDEEPDGAAVRVVSRIHRHLAPVAVAVLPLSRNERLLPTARRVHDMLRRRFNTQFDDAQSIGRRYRRQDEIGTPYCVTVDFDTPRRPAGDHPRPRHHVPSESARHGVGGHPGRQAGARLVESVECGIRS